MTALERLKAKIDEWKSNYETIAKENEELKKELENCADAGDAQEIANLKSQIEQLKDEIAQKDVEIEGILENIEELLD